MGTRPGLASNGIAQSKASQHDSRVIFRLYCQQLHSNVSELLLLHKVTRPVAMCFDFSSLQELGKHDND
jgi:hypothetical protein